ncbi:MAG: hypothetical protein HYS38_00335 [Acidobacteria bacterium]|nr:hypothetical protein [Acidobacteriota bacterium]
MRGGIFGRKSSPWLRLGRSDLKLEHGSRVAVIGGGPAGSFFSYFILDMAKRIGLDIEVDIYEPRDFSRPGPAGCNMCGGIISESLVQYLAVEGINLPPTVVQRGIDSYMLHMDIGTVRIDTPTHESRIGAIHRGAGPRGSKVGIWRSFDGYLLELARSQGAKWIQKRVEGINGKEARPQVTTSAGLSDCYDLLALAVGVNSSALKFLEGLETGYRSPKVTKTYICDLPLGRETIQSYLGSSMHVFLLDIPRLEFAALIPKGDYVTACLSGHGIEMNVAVLGLTLCLFLHGAGSLSIDHQLTISHRLDSGEATSTPQGRGI